MRPLENLETNIQAAIGIVTKDNGSKTVATELANVFEAVWDTALNLNNNNYEKAAAMYHAATAMIDAAGLTGKHLESLMNAQMSVATRKTAEYRQKNPLSTKITNTIEEQAFGSMPTGHGCLKGLLKSVVVAPTAAVLTPWIPEDDMDSAAAILASNNHPYNASIFKAGYLLFYGERFSQKTGSVLKDFSDLENDKKGLTASAFSRVILNLLQQIVKQDGAKAAYNFFESLVDALAKEVGESNFVPVVQQYGAVRGLKISSKSTKDVIHCVLANKKPPVGAGIMKIDDNLDLESGLELLYPFAPIVSSIWLTKRQDFGFIDGHSLYRANPFVNPDTGKAAIGIKFKILVSGSVTYVVAGDSQAGKGVADVSESGQVPVAYTLTAEDPKGKPFNFTLDDLLNPNQKVLKADVYELKARFIQTQQTLPTKDEFLFAPLTLDQTQKAAKDAVLPDGLKAGEIISIASFDKGSEGERYTWGLPMKSDAFYQALPFLKMLHGQNLAISNNKNKFFLFQVNDTPVNDEAAMKTIVALRNKSVIAQQLKGAEKFLLDN
jgi:hypothetical protein